MKNIITQLIYAKNIAIWQESTNAEFFRIIHSTFTETLKIVVKTEQSTDLLEVRKPFYALNRRVLVIEDSFKGMCPLLGKDEFVQQRIDLIVDIIRDLEKYTDYLEQQI